MIPAIPDKLAETITRNSSFQTYATIKLLVDRPLVNDCFKAYAYFRWLDDQIDCENRTKKERLAIIARQRHLIETAYHGRPFTHKKPEEQLLLDLIASDADKNSKLGSFILNFFAIIEFDAQRKGLHINQSQLEWYSQTLARAVTDGIEHFINHDYFYPNGKGHYLAAEAAHIVHMLRDYCEDIPEGYVNISREYLIKHGLKPDDINSPAFAAFVKKQLKIADQKFRAGKGYIDQLSVLRCKIAASWYSARFELTMNEIKKDNYWLRPEYGRRKLINYVLMGAVALRVTMRHLSEQVFKEAA